MPTLTALTRHSTGSPGQSSQARKRNKSIQIGEEEGKLSLFADDVISYVENPEDATKQLLELINNSGCRRQLGKISGGQKAPLQLQVPRITKVHFTPLRFYKRSALVPVFTDRKKTEEHFSLLLKKKKKGEKHR